MQIRAAREDEFDGVVRVLAEAGFGSTVGRLLQYPRTSPAGTILLATGRRRRVVGGAACASFGATGWIGALGVAPRARGKGIGGALTEAAVAWLRGCGAETVLLYATDMGRPVYARTGFVAEGGARAWRGSATGPPADANTLRSLRPADRDPVVALDRRATAEDRGAVLGALTPLVGLGAERDGELRGALLTSPWGAGPAILADGADEGVSLLRAARGGTSSPAIVTLPDANAAGTDALAAWGFEPVNHAVRMRLGPAVPWAPERVYGMFNLFWG
jgi:GNAT superfamily N-acetyltransferase